MPSTAILSACWKPRTAALVLGPNTPSTARPWPGTPERLRNRNSSWTPRTASPVLPVATTMTSAPRSAGRRSRRPLSGPRSGSPRTAASVFGPKIPSTVSRMPRRRQQTAGPERDDPGCLLQQRPRLDLVTSSESSSGGLALRSRHGRANGLQTPCRWCGGWRRLHVDRGGAGRHVLPSRIGRRPEFRSARAAGGRVPRAGCWPPCDWWRFPGNATPAKLWPGPRRPRTARRTRARAPRSP